MLCLSSRSRRLFSLAVIAMLASACALPSGLARRNAARLTIAPTSTAGQVTIRLKAPAELQKPQLLALTNNHYTRADIDHVKLTLYKVSGEDTRWTTQEWPEEIPSIVNFSRTHDMLGEDLTLTGPVGYTTYRVTAEAFNSAEESDQSLISTRDRRSWMEFSVGNDDELFQNTYEAIYKVRLRDREPMTGKTIMNASDGLGMPGGLVYDPNRDQLLVTDTSEGCLWRIENPFNSPQPSIVLDAAGQEPLDRPADVKLDPNGNAFVLDNGPAATPSNAKLIRLDLDKGDDPVWATPAMVNPLLANARSILCQTKSNYPGPDDTVVWVALRNAHQVKGYTVTDLNSPSPLYTFGASPGDLDGAGANASFNAPTGLAFGPYQNDVYVSENGDGVSSPFRLQLRKVENVLDLATSRVSTPIRGNSLTSLPAPSLAPDGTTSAATLNDPGPVVVDGLGNVYMLDGSTLRKFDVDGVARTLQPRDADTGEVLNFTGARGLALDAAGHLFVADTLRQRVVLLQ